MHIGIFGDTHDHVDHVRHAVKIFNDRKCELVLFAGDFVSPIMIPPLRKLNCRLISCFGDSDGNRRGITGGLRIIGIVGEPPFGVKLTDGTRILLTHQLETLKGLLEHSDVVISSHTHKPSIKRDSKGRLFINPGETSGWCYRQPTVVILDSHTGQAEIINLPEMPPLPDIHEKSS